MTLTVRFPRYPKEHKTTYVMKQNIIKLWLKIAVFSCK